MFTVKCLPYISLSYLSVIDEVDPLTVYPVVDDHSSYEALGLQVDGPPGVVDVYSRVHAGLALAEVTVDIAVVSSVWCRSFVH